MEPILTDLLLGRLGFRGRVTRVLLRNLSPFLYSTFLRTRPYLILEGVEEEEEEVVRILYPLLSPCELHTKI